MPLAEGKFAGYKFYRNVRDYGAKGDGTTDDVEAINAAISDGNRCGMECGNTFAQGALVYFPVGAMASHGGINGCPLIVRTSLETT